MDYAKAVKGLTANSSNNEIVEFQAEMELARKLTKFEINLLLKANSYASLCEKIKKVCISS